MEKIKKRRRGFSVFTLLFFVSMLLFENSIFAFGLNRTGEFIDFDFTYDSIEMEKWNSYNIQLDITGLDESVDEVQVSYRSLSDESYKTTEWFHLNDDGTFVSSPYIDVDRVPGEYAVDQIMLTNMNNSIIIYNERFYPEDEMKQGFPDKEYTIIGSYGGMKPDYVLTIPDKELIPDEMLSFEMSVDSTRLDTKFTQIQLHYNNMHLYETYTLLPDEEGIFRYEESVQLYDMKGIYKLDRISFIGPDVNMDITDETDIYGITKEDLSIYGFSITSTEDDFVGPILKGILLSGHVVTPARMESISIQAEDTLSGIKNGRVEFSRVDEFGNVINTLDYQLKNIDGILVSDLDIGLYNNSGRYVLTEVELVDNTGNYTYYSYEYDNELLNPEVNYIDVYGTAYNYQPITDITFSSSVTSPDSPVKISVSVDEEYMAYTDASMWLRREDGSQKYIQLEKVSEGFYEGEFRPSLMDASGSYDFYYISLFKLNEVKYISNVQYNKTFASEGSNVLDMELSSISVQDTLGDAQPEIIITSDKDVYGSNDVISLDLNMMPEFLRPDSIDLSLRQDGENNDSIYIELIYDAELDKYLGTISDIRFKTPGDYHVYYVAFTMSGERLNYYNSRYEESSNIMEFDGPVFTLENTLGGILLEYQIESDKKVYSENDEMRILFSLNRELFNPKFVRLDFLNTESSTYFNIFASYDAQLGKYVGINNSVYNIEPGSYELEEISIQEEDSHISYYNEKNNNSLSFATTGPLFEVENALWGYMPEITISTSVTEAKPGETVTVIVEVPTDVVNYTEGYIEYDIEGRYHYAQLRYVKPGILTYSHEVNQYGFSGNYEATALNLGGDGHGVYIYRNDENTDLSAGDYVVTGTTPDGNPPTLISVEMSDAIYTNDIVTFVINAEDDISGVLEGNLYVKLPDSDYKVHVGLKHIDGTLQGSIDSGNTPGILQIHEIYMEDVAGNGVYYQNETVEEVPEYMKPMNQGPLTVTVKQRILENFTISQEKNTYGPDEKVIVNVKVDEETDYDYITLTYLNPSGEELTLNVNKSVEGIFTAEYFIRSYYEAGWYELHEIQASANGKSYSITDGNVSEYGFAELKSGDFTVEGTKPDEVAPVFKHLMFSDSNLIRGEEQIITVVAQDDSSGVYEGAITYVHDESGDSYTAYLTSVSESVLKGYFFVDASMPSGTYSVHGVVLYDQMMNVRFYHQERTVSVAEDSQAYDFADYKFSIVGNITDKEPPEIVSIVRDKESYNKNEKIRYTLLLNDDTYSRYGLQIQYSDERGNVNTVYNQFETGREPYTFYQQLNYLFSWMPAGTYKVDYVKLADDFGNSTVLVRPGYNYYNEMGNIIEKDLSHLTMEIKDSEILDHKEYFSEIKYEKTPFPLNESAEIVLVPGPQMKDADRITLFYGFYGSYSVLTKGDDGNFRGEMTLNNAYAGGKVELEKIRAVFKERYIEIGDEYSNTPLLSNLSTGDFTVKASDEPLELVYRGVRSAKGTYTAGNLLDIEFDILNMQRYDQISVVFRIDGKSTFKKEYFQGMKNAYRIGAYDDPGVYTIDQITVYGENTWNEYLNAEYYLGHENSVAMDVSFTVKDTMIDRESPQFISITADKETAGVGETVTYTVEARDDASGIEYGLLNLEGPDGRKRELIVLHPNAMGVLQGTFTIKNDQMTGTWRPASVQIADYKGNITIIENTMALNTFWREASDMDANVEVTSSHIRDHKPPVFYGFSYLNIEGNKVVKLNAEDDLSGIRDIQLKYVSSDGALNVYGNVFTYKGEYYAELSNLDRIISGTLYLTEVIITDYQGNNMRYVHGTAKNGEYAMNLGFGTIYATEEDELTDLIDSVTIDGHQVSEGEDIRITLSLKKPISNNLQFVGVVDGGSHTREIYFEKMGELEYEAVVNVNNYYENGAYSLKSIKIKQNYYELLYSIDDISTTYDLEWSDELMNFSGIYFTVSGLTNNYNGLNIRDIRMLHDGEPNYVPGDIIKIQVEAPEETQKLSHLSLSYTNKYKNWNYSHLKLTEVADGLYETYITMHQYIYPGEWNIAQIEVYAENGDAFFIGSYEGMRDYYKLDGYEKLNFFVENENADYTTPVVTSVKVKHSQVLKGEEIHYVVEANDDLSGVKTAVLNIKGLFTGEEIYLPLEMTGEGVFEGSLDTSSMKEDTWRVMSVYAMDQAFNRVLTENTSYTNIGRFEADSYARMNMDDADVDLMSVKGLSIKNMPVKLDYFTGEKLDLTGLVVTATLNDGSEKILSDKEFTVTGYDSGKAVSGQEITVTYGIFTGTFKVNIAANELVSIEVTESPDKRIYYVGEKLDITGIVVIGTYKDGNKAILDVTMDHVTGFNSSEAVSGQILTVTVDGKSHSFSVDILKVETEPMKVVAGKTRYSTATAISQEMYNQADTVILVQATNFPDALAAGPLAYMLDAPILLTGTASLSSTAKAEIERLQAKKVIIMGGTGAVSANVEETLISTGYTVERVKGSNRYSTAVETAKYMAERSSGSNTVVLASGTQFADALAAGSYAAREGHPILLTNGSRLTSATMDYIAESKVDNIVLVGGTGVISQALEDELGKLGITISRKSGANRFDTSIKLTESFFGDSDTAVVANGMEFADALAAAPYAAKLNAPIILVNRTRTYQPTREYLPTSKIRKIIVVGGDGAVNEAVRNELNNLIR